MAAACNTSAVTSPHSQSWFVGNEKRHFRKFVKHVSRTFLGHVCHSFLNFEEWAAVESCQIFCSIWLLYFNQSVIFVSLTSTLGNERLCVFLFFLVMCLEVMTMNGNYQKDNETAPVHKKKWSKSKRKTFLRAKISERRRRVRAWSVKRPQLCLDRVDGTATRNKSYIPPVAMAPSNTTQYLMDLVYAERLDVSFETCDVSRDFSMQSQHVQFDESVFSLSDSDYDRSLDFQQRDFEDVLFRNEIWRVSETWLDFVGTRRRPGKLWNHRQ